jgi:dCTP deaminase
VLLNDATIRRMSINIDTRAPLVDALLCPFSEGVQSGEVISYGLSHAGYDLRLGDTLLVFKNSFNEIINPKRFKDEDYRHRVFDEVSPRHLYDHQYPDKGGACNPCYVIPPHSYALGASLEYIRIPRHIKGRCVGKSTLARCGILINTTPLEPGWHGYLTIEISNISPCAGIIYAREGIAQLEFETLIELPESDYEAKAGKYQAQGSAPVPARIKEDK